MTDPKTVAASPSHPYGRDERFHLQHVHLFASDLDQTIAFYMRWFDARISWDGDYGGARNVFMKIGIGALPAGCLRRFCAADWTAA